MIRINTRRLEEAEAAFLARFPQGFRDPALAQIRKRHDVDRLADFARANLTEATLAQPHPPVDRKAESAAGLAPARPLSLLSVRTGVKRCRIGLSQSSR